MLRALHKMCPPAYHHNGFVATHALGYMIYTYLFTSLNNFSSPIRLNMQQKILWTNDFMTVSFDIGLQL